MRIPRRAVASLQLLGAALGLALGQAGPARASSFSVNPTQVVLSGTTRSALVSIKNEGDEPVRFQLSMTVWGQSDTGEMRLQPTSDIIFFPALLTLGKGEERKVRVGLATALSSGPVEKSYRMFVEELPPATRKPGSGVAMLTKMGIPIFVQPARLTATAGLRQLELKAGLFGFRLENIGNVHFVPDSVRLRGLGADGRALFEQDLKCWYVLAGGVRTFSVPLTQPQCRDVRALAVEVKLGNTVLKEQLETPAGCGR